MIDERYYYHAKPQWSMKELKEDLKDLESRVLKDAIGKWGSALSAVVGTLGFFYGICSNMSDWLPYIMGPLASASIISHLYFDTNLYSSKLDFDNCYNAIELRKHKGNKKSNES
jgi:hypothetical protein